MPIYDSPSNARGAMNVYPSVKLAATTSTGRVAHGLEGAKSIIVQNPPGNANAWIKFGDDTVTANADIPSFLLLPGTVHILGLKETDTYIAGILTSGTGTLYFTPGYGGI